jgi:hypothetical protein
MEEGGRWSRGPKGEKKRKKKGRRGVGNGFWPEREGFSIYELDSRALREKFKKGKESRGIRERTRKEIKMSCHEFKMDLAVGI